MEHLRKKANSLTSENRIAILLFDEMHIQKDLDYDGKKDIIQGYEDDGKTRQPQLAKYILVFMVRGLFCQYQYFTSYYASAKGLTEKDLVDLIVNNISVCDQGSNNKKAYKVLGVTVEKPYFYLKDELTEIFAIFDKQHLIKSIRNNLIQSDIDKPDGLVSWEDIKE